MKYKYLLLICIILSGFSQAAGQWKKITVPNRGDSIEYLTAQKSNDEVILLTKRQDLYLYKTGEGARYRGSSNIRLGRFLSRRKIAQIFPDGKNVWYQLYQRGFLSRGHYDAIYYFNVQTKRAVGAQSLDSLFDNTGRITGSYYSAVKKITVFSTNCSGLIVRTPEQFIKRVSYNSALMDNCLNALAMDEQGHIWLASETAGLLEYNLREDVCRSLNIDNSLLTSNRIKNVKIGGHSTVYFNDYYGNLYTIKNDLPVNINKQLGGYEDTEQLHYSPDQEGNLWLYFTSDSLFHIGRLDQKNHLKALPAEDYPFEPTRYAVYAMYALRNELLVFTNTGLYSYRYRK